MAKDSPTVLEAIKGTVKNSPTILDRIANNDETAVPECIRTHGNWIWAVALNYSETNEAAEQLTMNIFEDIWRFAHRFKLSGLEEKTFVSVIIRRQLRGKTIPDTQEFGTGNKFYKPYKKYAEQERA